MVQKEILMSNGKGHALEEPDYTPNVEIMFWILKYKRAFSSVTNAC